MGARRLVLSRRIRGVRRTGILAVRRRIVPLPPRKWWLTWLIAGAAAGSLAGALFVVYRLWPAPALAATVPLKYGTVEQLVLTDALVVRSEHVATAPTAGDVSRLAAEGERVRVGSAVVRIAAGVAPGTGSGPGAQPGTAAGGDREAIAEAVRLMDARLYQLAASRNQAASKGDRAEVARLQSEMDATAVSQAGLLRQLTGGAASPAPGATTLPGGARAATAAPAAPAPMRDGAVTAETAGLLVYHVDGLEGSLSPAGAAAWTPSWFRTLAVPLQRNTGEGQVTAGAPLFKVVDNISQGLVLVVPAESVASLPTGSWVQLRFTGRDGLITARITRMVREGSEVLLQLTAPALPEDFAGRRKVQVSLVLSDYTGKVVPRSAIDVRDGRQGVWIWEGKQPEFRPAPVIGGNQQEFVLETDLPDGTRILRAAPRSMR